MRGIGLILAAVFTLVAAPVCGQSGDGTVRLREALRAGDHVRLTVHGGTLAGRVESVGADHVTVETDTGRQDVSFGSVSEARRTRRGFLLGTIIGTGVGIACGAAAASYAENEAGNGAAAFAFLTGVGFAAGAGIDALVNLERTVYRHESGPRVSIAPAVGPNGARVVASLRW